MHQRRIASISRALRLRGQRVRERSSVLVIDQSRLKRFLFLDLCIGDENGRRESTAHENAHGLFVISHDD
jgi:hypothetical protein